MKTLFRATLLSAPILLGGCVVICVGSKEHDCPKCNSGNSSCSEATAVTVTRHRAAFNVDFGPWNTSASQQTGPAAAGRAGDFWNVVAQPFNDLHTETNLMWADGKPSSIRVEMRNLGGGWGFSDKLGVKSPMLDNFNYPANNKGGDSFVLVHDLPKGNYDLYIYGHGTQPDYFGDYSVKCGENSYGRKTTYDKDNFGTDIKWVENHQYVKFSNVKSDGHSPLEVHIRPGNPVDSGHGTQISDAIIAGLQLVPK